MSWTRSLLCVFPLATPAAQEPAPWASFAREPWRIASARAISDAEHETDLAWGDLDHDGSIDLVVARKEPFISVGGRANVLLLNVDGVLTDRTASLAAASDVAGDRGFLTPTNDRDVLVADVDGDGWLDVVTSTDYSPGQPKHVSHPRVYRNLGSTLR